MRILIDYGLKTIEFPDNVKLGFVAIELEKILPGKWQEYVLVGKGISEKNNPPFVADIEFVRPHHVNSTVDIK